MSRPPRLAEVLLRHCLPRGLWGESALGDLHGEYVERAKVRGGARASAWYWSVALGLSSRYVLEQTSRVLLSGGLRPLGGDLIQDLRFGLRGARREPGWTAATLATLGLGIGATAAIFAVVNAVLLRPLPYSEPQELVILEYAPANDAARAAAASWNDYLARHFRSTTTFRGYENLRWSVGPVFRELAAYDDSWTYDVSFGPAGGSDRLSGVLVSASLFPLLGVPPQLGRWTAAEEDLEGAPGAVVLSHDLWIRKCGGRPDVVGSVLQAGGEPYTVVGIMPPGFSFPTDGPELWLSMNGASRGDGSVNYQVVGRIRDGLSMEQIEAGLASRALPLPRPNASPWEMSTSASSLRGYLVGDVRPALLLLLSAVGGLLLIACVNVVNLMLTRATSREHEHTVRAALGAGPGRLARQLLTESVLVCFLGASLGVILAWLLLGGLLAVAPFDLPRLATISVDAAVLAFTAGVAVLVGLAVGLVPSAHAFRLRRVSRLVSGERSRSGGAGHARLRDALVVLQLAVTLVIVANGGLLVRSFAALLGEETGFDPEGVLTMQTSLPAARYPDVQDRQRFYREILDEVGALPGVQAAGLTLYFPGSDEFHWTDLEVEGYVPGPDEEPIAEQKQVTPGYFTAMGMRFVDGRAFEGDDVGAEAPEVVVTESLARTYFPGGHAVGRQLRTDLDGTWTIAGVVADVRSRGASRDAPTLYLPYHASGYRGSMDVAVKVDGDPRSLSAALQRLVNAQDPEVVVFNVMPLDARLWMSVAGPRFRTFLLGAFGLVSLLLSMVGVYGVMAYTVAQRTRETGIRRALGAEAGRIVGRVAGHGLRLTGLGLALGGFVAFQVVGLMEGYLHDLEPHDPLTLALSATLLAAASMAACVVPALRAARVDPLQFLRAE